MADYATLAEAKAYGYQSTAADDAILTAILPRASRLFDRYVGVKPSYFDKYDGVAAASARKFWGDGTDYLQLDPYSSAQAITLAMPTGYTAPPYLESRNLPMTDDGQGFFLIRTYSNNESRFPFIKDANWDENAGALFAANITTVGWPEGVKVTITAKWGWDAIPVDVTEAVLEMAIATWRGKDQAFARVVNLDTNISVVEAMPARARLIADRYKQGRGMFA